MTTDEPPRFRVNFSDVELGEYLAEMERRLDNCRRNGRHIAPSKQGQVMEMGRGVETFHCTYCNRFYTETNNLLC